MAKNGKRLCFRHYQVDVHSQMHHQFRRNGSYLLIVTLYCLVAMDEERLRQDLTCPITLALFQDPVSVPCCGKAFERGALVQNLQHRTRCPLCNGDLSAFDAAHAAKNVLLAGLVDTLENKVAVVPAKEHHWTCTATPITATSNMCELALQLENAKFKTRPALFIAVLDRSGSMGGRPGEQVGMALKHIEALAKHNNNVHLVMLAYESACREIQHASEYHIGGGTNFRAAFEMIDQVLRRYVCSDAPKDAQKVNNVCSVNIAFMTDGQDNSGNRQALVPEFKEMLRTRWGDNPLRVHTVGFGHGCDRELLENMRLAGTLEGFYRYAEHNDDDDTLCQKLTGIFEMSSKASTVALEMTMDGRTETIRFPVNARKHGNYIKWVDLAKSNLEVLVRTTFDDNVHVPVRVCRPSSFVMQRWLHRQVDVLAGDILALQRQSFTKHIRTLCCALLLQKIDAIEQHNEDADLTTQLQYLAEQVEQLKIGNAINAGKVSDLRSYSSMSLFESKPGLSTASRTTDLYSTQTLKAQPQALDDKPYFERPLKRYKRNNDGKQRNALQCAIMDTPHNYLSADMTVCIAKATREDVLHTDADGNNSIMLAAYCGHAKILAVLLKRFPNLNLALSNAAGETAATLAIKKRGFHYTLGVLLDAGAKIPRCKSMERYCIDCGYMVTAEIVAQCGDGTLDVDLSMKPETIRYVYARAKKSDKPWDPQHFFEVALAKKMKALAAELLKTYPKTVVPTIDMLIDYAIPPKPDSPETPFYLQLADMLLKANPDLIKAVTKEKGESALFAAANKGSLPHVTFFLEKGAVLEQRNAKGNTPLWVAAFKRYPCIMDELLDRGADVNATNDKGNPPLYGPCTRGGRKVAEQLIARGADVEHVNSNGDTLVLICCRNGQHDSLEVLLQYVDEEFANRKAHIDGFNAIMACAEQDRHTCMRLLQEYGIALDQKTDKDNAILASATPLHIASYYGRAKAVKMALQLGANPNVQNDQGQTPLHLAVIQGNIDIIKLLRQHDADLNVQDKAGNVPMAYTRDRADVRKVLVDPVLDIMMTWAKGGFTKDEEKQACQMLVKYAGVPGCLPTARVVDVRDYDGSTPLLQAVIHGKFDMVQTLVALNASSSLQNKYSMDSWMWASWLRNRRAEKLLARDDTDTVPAPLKRLRDATKARRDVQMLFLGRCPDNYVPRQHSGIGKRMTAFLNTPRLPGDKATLPDDKTLVPFRTIDVSPAFNADRHQLAQRVWDAKVFAIHKLASGTTTLPPHDLITLALLTNNPHVYRAVNTAILTNALNDKVVRAYVSALYKALRTLPRYVGEAYIGSENAQRNMYTIGQSFSWQHFASASTLWKVALENAPRFTTKTHEGVVFIVQSKTGRAVGPYSAFSFDAEVIFLPGTRFKVKNWYHGDVIALGQANIREHTFGVKEQDDERAPLAQLRASKKSVIIELVEV